MHEPTSKLIRLISWHDDVDRKSKSLKAPGQIIDASPFEKISSVVGEMSRLNPAVLVLDLDKVPSRSREIAIALRSSKSARHIPLLFVGGEAAKVERIRAEIPDVFFTEWKVASPVLKQILKRPAIMQTAIPHRNYGATPLFKKLGIKPQMKVVLLGAPDAFVETLGDLPDGASFSQQLTAAAPLVISFVRSLAEVAPAFDMLAARLPRKASVWVAYPKRGRLASDLNENILREAGICRGLVDYKICSVDSAWSAVKFTHRRK
jgi:hypothetical protein